jgi:hypothetical protein
MESTAQPVSSLGGGTSLDDALKQYNNNFSYLLIKFAILTIIHVLILVWALLGTGLADLVNNWPKYRCNPLIMPFAGLFGYDAGENFNYCMKNIFSSNAGTVLAPVYGVMANFTDIIGTITNVANSFRYLISNLLHGMERLIGSFRDRFQFILFSIRMSFLKIMNLMGRLNATFYAVVFMGLSAIKGINNVAQNDLIKFMTEFCFAKNTPIEMLDGSIKPISKIKIGDKLKIIDGNSPTVTSLFKFNGTHTNMVDINTINVSSQHFVKHNNNWIEAEKHPDAKPVASHDIIYCLNTDTHTISINNMIFSDYDESSDSNVVTNTKQMAEAFLNNGHVSNTKDDVYDLGICSRANIILKNGLEIPLSNVSIGDVLADNGVVLGLVTEQVSSIVKFGKLEVSSAQMMWDSSTNKWSRACTLYPFLVCKLEKPKIFHQLIVSNNIIRADGLYFRDYREISSSEMENAYIEKLKEPII